MTMNGNFHFTPTLDQTKGIHAPYWEEARADYAPYYRSGEVSGRSIDDAKNAVIDEMAKLEAAAVRFTEGFFGDKPRRYGYVITFQHMGGAGRIQVAGLPMNGQETERKIRNVRVQALLNVRDWLKTAVTAQVFAPGSYPLLQHLLVNETQTLAEAAIEARGLPDMNPLLPSGS